jgi:putative lipoic acid-binding regulatory protein
MTQPTESILEFPCRFPIKVMGPAGTAFAQRVRAIAAAHVPDLAADAVTCRSSAGGRFQSVTVTVHATSRDQLDNLYRALSAAEQVLMVL